MGERLTCGYITMGGMWVPASLVAPVGHPEGEISDCLAAILRACN